MIRATAAILIKDGKILIAQKGPHDKRANKWEFPGGKIDPGETPEQCLAREMLEEFEIEISVNNFFAENLHTFPDGQVLVLAYLCSWTGGEINATEHADYKWVDASELCQFDIVSSDVPIAEKICLKYSNT